MSIELSHATVDVAVEQLRRSSPRSIAGGGPGE
jgi:hypothetical protein